MQAYATLFGVLALLSACFVDNGIQPYIAKAGRVILLVTGALFVVTEAIALLA